MYEKVNITIRNQPFDDPTRMNSLFPQPAIAEEEAVSVVPADTKTGFDGLPARDTAPEVTSFAG